MLKRTGLALLLAAAVLIPTSARAQDAGGMPDMAFVFEARMGVTANGTVFPGLFAGVRLIGRLHIGLAFSLARTANPAQDTTTFTFAPVIAFDILKAAGNKVAFYAIAGLPVGAQVFTATGAPDDTNFVIGYNFGAGVRWAAHPMFCLGLESGLAGTFVDPEGKATHARSVGVTNIYGALVGTFMWGFGKK